ncbi:MULTISPECIES: NAD(P)/FAD-dependent oxidoreductase [Nocardia]|uniref:NAD(P)/FAD-dependent oxidoreductase n=1 Tax=Nocardia TaxID=1817 RepID=UPI0007EA1BCB|nr:MULTISPECIES: FAD/NAD(P)-binding oxidoreductase [Nocardia]MBF6277238.1 NAD(P)/FAD-dependent oxidoreductase [Nocardia nova]OBB50485.1 dehydrogenase [Nocardia sp. 852002-51244_SCH5132740]OBF65418.1 dehydrogenase [Mycobacterium sp. 852002-51759_SCH5129042]
MSRTTVVLGAGVGGLTAAAELREILPDGDRVVLIDRSFRGSLGLSMLWVLRGWRTPQRVTVQPDAKALDGVELITGEVQAIDTASRTVDYGEGESIRYDALVIALGAQLDPSRLPGLPQALDTGVAGEFYGIDAAADLHRRIEEMEAGRVLVLVAAVPFKCPAAPFEAAFLIADQLGDRFTTGAVSVDVFTPDPLPMPVAGPAVGNALVDMMGDKNIGFHGQMPATAVDPDARAVEFADGTRESFDLLAVVPPHTPGAALASTGLGPAGWIPVDPATLATTAEGVFAVGDATALMLANGKPLPKAAIFAEEEGRVAAHQAARFLGYDAPDTHFTGHGACYVELGADLAAKGEGDFLADPAPQVTLHEPSAAYHREKEQQERDWLQRWTDRA